MEFTNTIGKKIAIVIVMTIFLGLLSCTDNDSEDVNPHNATLEFEQIDFDLDGNITTNSSWGSMVLTYDGALDILYFSLAVDSRWVIQNIPVLSHEGEGVTQSITLTFDLGVSADADVTELEYAFNLTTTVLDLMPSDFQAAPVGDRSVVFYSGGEGEGTDAGEPPPKVEGGEVEKSAKHEEEFPNQECGKKECVPVAVSNSLQFLNKKYDLGLGGEGKEIDIGTMKEATGWIEGGGCVPSWWKDKKRYMEGNNYPITTDMVTDFEQIIKEIERGQDVELNVVDLTRLRAHCAAVVGIAKLKNGKYSIDIVHDTKQGEPGGTIKETVIYDPDTEKFKGGMLVDGADLNNFVVECPKEE